MNIHFDIHATSVADFASALGELAAKFGHGRTPHVAPAGEDVQSLLDRANALLKPMGMAAVVMPTGDAVQVAVQPVVKTTGTTAVTTEDLSGDAEDTSADEDTHGEDPAPEEPPAPDTGGEKAKEEALDMLRQVYARGAKGQKKIKELQAKYGVAKFVEVPAARGDELLADAKAAIVAVPAKGE